MGSVMKAQPAIAVPANKALLRWIKLIELAAAHTDRHHYIAKRDTTQSWFAVIGGSRMP